MDIENAKDLFTNEDIDKIIEMYKADQNVDRIIEEFHTEEHNIRVVLKEFQVDRKYNTFNAEIYDRIADKYLNGMSQYKISYDLLVSDMCIRKELGKRNIQRRSYSENNRRYNRNSHYFDKIDTQNKAYILGLLFADGNNHIEHNAITLSLQEEDGYILEFVKKELEYEGPIRFKPLHEKNENYKNQYILCINDPYMSKHLEKLGVVNAKSLKVIFPDYIRMKFINHFVRGYFDGDGCISVNASSGKPRVSICGTYEFCERLSCIIHSMNGTCSIYHPKQCTNKNTYTLNIEGYNSVNNFMEWLYYDAEFKMERKYQKYLSIKESHKTNVNSLIA